MKHKIAFHITPDADGFPPFTVESMWATSTPAALQYELDNIPFFARQATLGDIVEARKTPTGLVFDKVILGSSNSLIRVVLYQPELIKETRASLKALGCATEEFKGRPLIAVNVPLTASLAKVQAYLARLEREDLGSYEEPILRQ